MYQQQDRDQPDCQVRRPVRGELQPGHLSVCPVMEEDGQCHPDQDRQTGHKQSGRLSSTIVFRQFRGQSDSNK